MNDLVKTANKSPELKAKEGCCEEASLYSHNFYIPCNAPAAKIMFSKGDDREYRMCLPCADHNKNRGMVEIRELDLPVVEKKEKKQSTTDLVPLQTLTPAIFDTPKQIDDILDDMKKKVADFKADVSTKKGRDEITSFAYQITRSGTALDKLGKESLEKVKLQTDLTNKERRRIKETLNDLKDKVRKPLVEYNLEEERKKEEEEKRKGMHQAAIASIINVGYNLSRSWQDHLLEDMSEGLKEVQELTNRDWQEFAEEARTAIYNSAEQITEAIEKRKKHDEEQAELKILREEKEERERLERVKQVNREKKERDQKIRKEAAEKEKQKAEAQKQKLIQDKKDAERREKEAAEKAEQARLQAIKDKEDAAKKAEQDIEDAKEAERQKIKKEEAEKKRLEEERKADQEHRERILEEACDALMNHSVFPNRSTARLILKDIENGEIPHVTIKF